MESESRATSVEGSMSGADTGNVSSGEQLKYRAIAFGVVALVFAALFVVDMFVPDPVPLVEEIAFLLGSVFSGRASLNAAR